MPSLFDILNVGSRALGANKSGLTTISHNVSNVGTAGFSRRDLMLGSLSSNRGVEVLGMRRAVDSQLIRQLRDQSTKNAFAEARTPLLQQVETVLGDLGDTGLGAAIDEFFTALQQLSASPDDLPLRNSVLASADNIAATTSRMAGDLNTMQKDFDGRLRGLVPEINNLLAQVAGLNKSIKEAEASNGDGGDFRDQRDQAVQRLAELTGAKTIIEKDGDYLVLIGGMRVVQDDRAEQLALDIDPTTGHANLKLAGAPGTDITQYIGGEAGAYIDVRDNVLTSQLVQLDQFAADFMNGVNAQHAVGFGLDGASGRNLFAPPAAVAGAAVNMSLDAAVVGNPQALAAAQDALSVPGDGRNALALVDLQGQDLALGGTATFSEAIGVMLADIGQVVSTAKVDRDREGDRMSQLEVMREQVSGVDLEEQLLLMSRYQRAYDASTRVVSTINEMLETLVNLKR